MSTSTARSCECSLQKQNAWHDTDPTRAEGSSKTELRRRRIAPISISETLLAAPLPDGLEDDAWECETWKEGNRRRIQNTEYKMLIKDQGIKDPTKCPFFFTSLLLLFYFPFTSFFLHPHKGHAGISSNVAIDVLGASDGA